jgi:hypothetical protein
LTGAQATALLDVFTAEAKGLVPASAGGDTANFLRADGVWAPPPAGTVADVSIVSANGLAGTVANSDTTAAITLSTSATGVLRDNGTAISAAVAGTDYAPATSGTSILAGDGGGGLSNVSVGSGLSLENGTLAAASYDGGFTLTEDDIGVEPNQIPLAGMLGEMAFADKNAFSNTFPLYAGTGITSVSSVIYAGGYTVSGGLKEARILTDLTGLRSASMGDTHGHINSFTDQLAPCSIAQVPTGMTVLSIAMTCIQTNGFTRYIDLVSPPSEPAPPVAG